MKLQEALSRAGLSHNESIVYLYLLEHGQASPPEISKGTRIILTNLYYVLESLSGKRLIANHVKGKRKIYTAKDPLAVLHNLDEEKKMFESVIPDLRGLLMSKENKPKVKFYDGADEIMHIFALVLEAKDEILGVASTKQLFSRMPEVFIPNLKVQPFAEEIKKRKIFLRDLLTFASGEKAAKRTKKEMGIFYDYHLLPEEYGDIPVDILIWNNSLALISLGKSLFGTVIEDPHLASILKILFNMAWKQAEKSVIN